MDLLSLPYGKSPFFHHQAWIHPLGNHLFPGSLGILDPWDWMDFTKKKGETRVFAEKRVFWANGKYSRSHLFKISGSPLPSFLEIGWILCVSTCGFGYHSYHGQSAYPHVRYPHDKYSLNEGVINHSCSLNKALLRFYFSWGLPHMGVGWPAMIIFTTAFRKTTPTTKCLEVSVSKMPRRNVLAGFPVGEAQGWLHQPTASVEVSPPYFHVFIWAVEKTKTLCHSRCFKWTKSYD